MINIVFYDNSYKNKLQRCENLTAPKQLQGRAVYWMKVVLVESLSLLLPSNIMTA